MIISSACDSNMSSALDLLRSFSKTEKPYYGFKKLPLGNYEIKSLRLVRNKHYKKTKEGSLKQTIIAELEDQVLFLPEYFAKHMQNREDMIEEFNNSGVKNFLVFGGKREKSE